MEEGKPPKKKKGRVVGRKRKCVEDLARGDASVRVSKNRIVVLKVVFRKKKSLGLERKKRGGGALECVDTISKQTPHSTI